MSSRARASVARSISCRCAIELLELARDRVRLVLVLRHSSSTPRSAWPSRPTALSRGARMKPTRPAVSGFPSSPAARISARSPGFVRLVEQLEPVAREDAILAAQRRDVGDRRERDEIEHADRRAFSLPPTARVSASASLNATPTAARSLSATVTARRFGLSTARHVGSGPPGR